MTKHINRNTEETNENQTRGNEAAAAIVTAEVAMQILEQVSQVNARLEFQDRRLGAIENDMKRLDAIEKALGSKPTATTSTGPGFISRTWTRVVDNKWKVVTGTLVLIGAGFGGYKYYNNDSSAQ